MEINEIQNELIVGKLEDGWNVLTEGSTYYFKKENIIDISGSVQWIINYLSVKVSEKIVYDHEKVGYFYSFFQEDPLVLSRYYHATSETHELKKDISMVTVPLASLVSLDPLVEKYLELPAVEGYIRVNEDTFQEYLEEPRNVKIYPRGYVAD